MAFLDASKAFDKISHWTLFKKMIDRYVPIYLVKILCYWYQHQEIIVQWGSCLSNAFFVTNGVRQGGILSPMLFNIYIDGLSDILNKSTIGGSIGGNCINHMIFCFLHHNLRKPSMQLPIIKHEFPRQSLRYKLITTLNEMSAETMELAKNYTQKHFVDLVRNNIVNGYRNTCVGPRNCYTCNNSYYQCIYFNYKISI